MWIVYFVTVLFATVLGGATGMGGGIIIKPTLDMLGHYNASGISMLSSITVFAMAVVSILRQRGNEDSPPSSVVAPLSIGAAIGGILGSFLLDAMIAGNSNSGVTILQNIILAVLVALIFVYLKYKEKLPSLNLASNKAGAVPAVVAGLTLGVVSSFLGIGGGPINVPVIIFCFGFSVKKAAICSLFTILSGQMAKILIAAIAGGFGAYDLSMLPVMLAGAVIGGFVGGSILKKVSKNAADVLFKAALCVVLCMCAVNILKQYLSV